MKKIKKAQIKNDLLIRECLNGILLGSVLFLGYRVAKVLVYLSSHSVYSQGDKSLNLLSLAAGIVFEGLVYLPWWLFCMISGTLLFLFLNRNKIKKGKEIIVILKNVLLTIPLGILAISPLVLFLVLLISFIKP